VEAPVATTDAVTEEISPADTSDSGVPEQNSGVTEPTLRGPEFCSGTPESLVSAGLISSVTASVVATSTREWAPNETLPETENNSPQTENNSPQTETD
jgi:hypothetical protein